MNPTTKYSTTDIAWIIRGGTTNKAGRETHRRAMKPEDANNWLMDAHGLGEIDDEQLRMFWADCPTVMCEACGGEGGSPFGTCPDCQGEGRYPALTEETPND